MSISAGAISTPIASGHKRDEGTCSAKSRSGATETLDVVAEGMLAPRVARSRGPFDFRGL